ncbi:MAG TPA: HD domain-containing phosphohydrolase [Pirellulales bacterium]|nr:HD domain-containing phosphohydrolase [Pirellulales bacterium]
MDEPILFVDDDPNLLSAVARGLRARFQLETALGPEQGLELVQARGPHQSFAVVVADMQMPGMNGVELLRRVAEIAPLSVRIMLTGQADQQTAIDAINQGSIFRFLTKPCGQELLAGTLTAGLEQYRLLTAEKELLVKTLSGSVRLLADMLALAKPKAFSRAARVRKLVQDIAAQHGIEPAWPLEIGAMLSHLGCVTLPETVLEKVCAGQSLGLRETALFYSHPRVGAELLGNIPRLAPVAEIVAYQEKHFDGAGPPDDGRSGEDIPLGARVLKLALDFDVLRASGENQGQALAELHRRKGWYDPAVLETLARLFNCEICYESRTVLLSQLEEGMLLDQHVLSSEGDILVTRGQEVSLALIQRLRNYAQAVRGVQQPISVLMPIRVTETSAGIAGGTQ